MNSGQLVGESQDQPEPEQTDKAREMRIEVAAGSASTGGKRGESTIEERILSTDGPLF